MKREISLDAKLADDLCIFHPRRFFDFLGHGREEKNSRVELLLLHLLYTDVLWFIL